MITFWAPILSKAASVRLRAVPNSSAFQRTFATTRLLAQPQQRVSKVFESASSAVADICSGSTILSSGFGLCGVAGKVYALPCQVYRMLVQTMLTRSIPETLIQALSQRGKGSLHSLTAISNNAGTQGGSGLSLLTEGGQLSRLVLPHLGNNKLLEKIYLSGEIAIELCPQGTLPERLRAGGAGIPAFFTPTGARRS